MPSARVVRFVAAAVAAVAGIAACASCSTTSKAELERALPELAKNRALARHGIRRVGVGDAAGPPAFAYLHVPRRDGASGAPLVFVHGTPSTLFNWSALLDSASPGAGIVGEADIYLLEVAGHGFADPAAPAASFQDCADHVRGFLVALDLRDVTLVGHSYGGEFAWRAALDAPERVARLVLIDSSGYAREEGAWLPEEHKLREWPGAQFGYLLNSRERLRPALQLHFGVPLDADQLEEMYLCCDNASNWRAMTALCRDENGTREREIAALPQPTLLVWGERDLAYPVESVARRFEREIAGARLAVIANAGHYPHEEQPGAVHAAIRAFHFEARVP